MYTRVCSTPCVEQEVHVCMYCNVTTFGAAHEHGYNIQHPHQVRHHHATATVAVHAHGNVVAWKYLVNNAAKSFSFFKQWKRGIIGFTNIHGTVCVQIVTLLRKLMCI